MKVTKKVFRISRQYHQLRIKSEICISLDIILNAFKFLTASLSTQILTLAIEPLLLTSVSILYEFALLSDVYILLSTQGEEVHSSSWADWCTHLAAHSSKRLTAFFVVILVCLGNTAKTRDFKTSASSLVLLVYIFDKAID